MNKKLILKFVSRNTFENYTDDNVKSLGPIESKEVLFKSLKLRNHFTVIANNLGKDLENFELYKKISPYDYLKKVNRFMESPWVSVFQNPKPFLINLAYQKISSVLDDLDNFNARIKFDKDLSEEERYLLRLKTKRVSKIIKKTRKKIDKNLIDWYEVKPMDGAEKRFPDLVTIVKYEPEDVSLNTSMDDENAESLKYLSSVQEEIKFSFVSWENYNGKQMFPIEGERDEFIEVLAAFFTKHEYQLPQKKYKIIDRVKGETLRLLKEIHSKFNTDKILRSDTDFYDLLRTLSNVQNLEDQTIYKEMTR